MNFTAQHLVISFDGFYSNGTSKDFILGPPPEPQEFQDIATQSAVLNILIQNALGFTSTLNCNVIFALGNNVSVVDV